MRMKSTVAGGSSRRAGFTLIEFMIALVLFAMVGGAMVGLISRQQRFYRVAHEMLSTRAQLRYAGMLLPTDLRPLYPAGGDVYAWRDTMVDFRQVLGSGVACRIFPAVGATQRIGLPPRTLSRQSVLTSWIGAPQVGDSVLIYDEGFNVGNDDDGWRPYGITAVTVTTGAASCDVPFVPAAGDLAAEAYVVTLGQTLPLSVIRGAPVRIFRRARYSLFQQPSDGKWYLGYTDCVAGRAPVCPAPTPVAGPYRPYSTTAGASGLAFTYRDVNGTALVPGVDLVSRIARIDLVTRTETTPTAGERGQTSRVRDSLKTSIGLRNRSGPGTP
jgi:prepilin-type N-terminal cleavage/methylation domain-containing protein